MVTRSHARSIYRVAPAATAAVAASGSGRAAFSLRLVARSHARSIYRVSDLGGVPVDPAAVAAIQELSVVPAPAAVSPAAAVAVTWSSNMIGSIFAQIGYEVART